MATPFVVQEGGITVEVSLRVLSLRYLPSALANKGPFRIQASLGGGSSRSKDEGSVGGQASRRETGESLGGKGLKSQVSDSAARYVLFALPLVLLWLLPSHI